MMKKGNNKGFSLIEIVIGIGMLAVIVIPILHSFITSAQINRDSRQMMIQTEVAQTIMEGFAGKTYADVKASVDELGSAIITGSGIVSGNLALSSIDGNVFNNADEIFGGDLYSSGITWSGGDHLKDQLTDVQKSRLMWQGHPIEPICENVSDNSLIVSMNQLFIRDMMLYVQLRNGHSVNSDQRQFVYWETPLVNGASGGTALFIGYGNIQYEGYYFDAVVSFLPMAHNESDLYYTYKILITLYENDRDMWFGQRGQHLLMVMDGGIMAGQ